MRLFLLLCLIKLALLSFPPRLPPSKLSKHPLLPKPCVTYLSHGFSPDIGRWFLCFDKENRLREVAQDKMPPLLFEKMNADDEDVVYIDCPEDEICI